MTLDQEALLQPPILHLVLLHLPQVDLLLSQRVCRTWRALIQRSKTLQQALYIRSDDPSQDDHVQANELLRHHFPGFYGTGSKGDSIASPFASSPWHHAASVLGYDPAKSDAYTRAEASWRRMLPCQPAPNELRLISLSRGMMGTRGVLRIMSAATAPQGVVTFGLLYDIVQNWSFPSVERQAGRDAHVFIGERDEEALLFTRLGSTPEAREKHFGGKQSAIIYLVNHSQCRIRPTPENAVIYPVEYMRSRGSLVALTEPGTRIAWQTTYGLEWDSETDMSKMRRGVS